MSGENYLDLNGSRAVKVDIQIPYLGAIVADVEMALPGTFTGTQLLTVGNLVISAAQNRGGNFAGEFKTQLVGGFGGWPTVLTAQAYQNAGGIMASVILKDAAANVGEKVNVVSDYTLGQFWTVEAAPASRQLRILAQLWWIDPATGITQVNNTRPSNAISSDFEVIEYNPAKGLFKITSEDPASWMPGNTFVNPFLPGPSTISSTRIVCDDSGEMHLHVLSV